MSKETISASGERAAIGGYLPQFDEFAWFVYLNLINKNLEWIRIADPKAEKLDDIQYSTHSEIHAYQVKWTISEANISFANFIQLFPLITSSWKNLKKNNPTKKIIPHLITNKSISSHDSLKSGKTKIGSFNDFIFEAWQSIRSNQSIDDKWNPIIQELKSRSKLNESEFHEFIQCFDFQYGYKKREFGVQRMFISKEEEDLVRLARFLWEEVGGNKRNIEFSREGIIQKLGWVDRFKTIFNHELIVDRKRYQPIQSTIDLLNSKLNEHKNGYLFLLGGPGSGKSTLLTQWSKGLKTRIIKYYAFDFTNPSSHLNFYERGNAIHLFFDLVFQIKEAGIYKRDILPYKDLLFLKDVFAQQLKAIGQDYNESGQQTIIIIDGLDHVPREYKSTAVSFLRELPLPGSLPEGVFMILGSQSFELEDIQQEIKTEFQKGSRTIDIDSLKKEEVYTFIDSLEFSTVLTSSQKLKIFEKSQGHPLYLSYLIEKINEVKSIDDVINSFDKIEGDIVNYYKKIWDPIQKEESLISLLGLISRINGSINLYFIKEWGFQRSVLKLFKENAQVLFNKTGNILSFFHNSFKQFLLYHTSLNYLTDDFDSEADTNYHIQLAEYYKHSGVEKSWKRNHHLFRGKQYDDFISEVSPDSFTSQLINFRPAEEVKQDAKLGIEIAKQTKNVNTLVRYLFSLAEIEKRLFHIDPASFTKELLILNKFDLARNYLRTGNTLHCSASYALKASRLFIEQGYKSEGEMLFNLAYPDIITESGITIDDSYRYEEIRNTLEEWVYTSPHFETTKKVFSIIENITFSVNALENRFEEKENDLHLILLVNFGYSLVDQNKWDDFNQVIKKLGSKLTKEKNSFFLLMEYAIEHCLSIQDNSRGNEYLTLLTTRVTKEKLKANQKIHIADLIYKVTRNTHEVFNWIKDIEQPFKVDKDKFGYSDSLDTFYPIIKLNKLLNLCQKGVPITSAIPSVEKGTDEEVLVEFERMLCLTTQILSDGILQNPLYWDISKRVYPIVRFYYKDIPHRNSYWYKLKQSKGQYFDFLIYAVSLLSSRSLETLGEYLFSEFFESPKYWGLSIRRKIIKSLLSYGFNSEKAKIQLKKLEESMLLDHGIESRIEECLAHAQVWFILNEPEEGEKWLKQAIQESIGVGYSKDYQFSTWINWLRKINQKDSANAPERIKWFLSHLNHIKETTEGRAYWNASEELLEVTYSHCLSDGLEQTIWQLDHGLVDFKDSISIFIEYFVKRITSEEELKSIIQLYTDLYLRLAESANSSLLKHILIQGNEVLEEKFLKEYVPTLISSINIRAYEETRYYLLSEIEDYFLSKGISIRDYYPDFIILAKKETYISSNSSNTLVLKTNYERMDESEVLEQIRDFNDFKRLVQKEDKTNSYFDWSKVIEKIVPLLSSTQIKEFGNIIGVGKRESDSYAKLSEAAFNLGDEELAIGLANKSIELSGESGWVEFYDGGTRIKAFSALKKINPKLSSNKAFEIFVHDILRGDYSSSYIEYLEDIVPLLTENYNEQDLWLEIFDYLQRLMSNSRPTEDLPTILSINRPILETLVDYLVYLLKSPITLIQAQSNLLIARFIHQNNDYALTQLLNQNIDDYSSINVIMALFELNSPKIYELKSKIQNLALSNDYQLREDSKHVLSKIGEEIPTPKNIVMPSLFSLLIPETKKIKFNKEVDPYFPEVDINNPQDLIRPFEFLISVLSEESKIDESNLIYRAYSIMKEIAQEDEWTVEYEKKLRGHLDEIHLKYPYLRPRVIAAQRAIMRLTCELIDSGTIEEGKIRTVFKSHDYAVPHFTETEKPLFIQTIKERDFGGVGKDWLDRINESPRLTESLLDYGKTFKVIAEYSQIINLNWGAPTEEYMSQIAVNDELDENKKYIFGSVFHQLTNEYYDLGSKGPFIVVFRDHRFDQFDLKSRWIAINPVLARYLGWEPEHSKLFAWKNSQGELMAESIYWLNGNMEMTPRKDGEVGEGWFVIVSENGLEQIKSIKKSLFLQKKLIRSKYDDSILIDNRIFNVTRI